MSSLSWKIRRLKAMGAGEIALRVRRKLRDKLSKPKYLKETPEQTFERLFPTLKGKDLAAYLRERQIPRFFSGYSKPDALSSIAEAVLEQAEPILRGQITLFGQTIQLDDPPKWNRNYFHGGDWPLDSADNVDYHDIKIAGGVKYTWEPSRHAFLLKLAQAHYLSHGGQAKGESRFGDLCAEWWLDWIEENPANFGIHWTSALEMAVRIFIWSWMLELLKGHPRIWNDAALRQITGHMAQQASYTADNFSFGSSANNHLIGEAASVCYFATLFPECIHSERWQRSSRQILEREIERQVHPDGVPAEQAFGYLPFVWEFYLLAYGLLKVNGASVPEIVRNRLNASLEFARTVMDKNGSVFQVGDEDEGEVIPFYGDAHNRYCAVGRAIASLVESEPLPKLNEQDDAYCLWLWGKASGQGSFAKQSKAFKEGGYALMRTADAETVAMFDCGPLGLGSLAAHGHADALQFCLSAGGEPVLIDPGTYAYHEDPKWRDYFRSTAQHNTIIGSGANQSLILGPFLWGDRADASLERWVSNEAFDYAEAIVKYLGAITKRTVIFLKPHLILIGDKIKEIENGHVLNDVEFVSSFNLAPDLQMKTDEDVACWTIEKEGRALIHLTSAMFKTYRPTGSVLDAVEALTPAISQEWCSPRFGEKVPCKRLSYRYRHTEAGGQWLAICTKPELSLTIQPFGFQCGDIQVALADASPWRGQAALLAAKVNEAGVPTAICGVDLHEVRFKDKVIHEGKQQTFGWRQVQM